MSEMSYVTFREKAYKVKRNSLILRNKGITSIDEIVGLQNLQYLVHLDLSNNNITEIEGLQNLTNLVHLDLSGNYITEIKGLENLRRLRILKLSRNQITEIKGLDTLKDLLSLFLDNNQISELKGLENIHKLNALYLANNYITDIKGIEHLRNLKRFDIGARARAAIPKEQIQRVQKAGTFTKDQRYFEKRGLLILGIYFTVVAVSDFIITSLIVSGFQMGLQAYWPMFGVLFLVLMIGIPILYCIAKEYSYYGW